MEQEKIESGKSRKILLIAGIVVLLIVAFGLGFYRGLDSDDNKISNQTSEEEGNTTNDEPLKYSGQSFVGYYQVLEYEYFDTSKYDPNKYSKISLEIQLIEDGKAKIAYELNDEGNITSNQYDATYELVNTLTEEINGDHYKTLELSFTSPEANDDSVISFLSNTSITYNPATNPTDGSQPFNKSLVFRHNGNNMIPYMVNVDEIKYLK